MYIFAFTEKDPYKSLAKDHNQNIDPKKDHNADKQIKEHEKEPLKNATSESDHHKEEALTDAEKRQKRQRLADSIELTKVRLRKLHRQQEMDELDLADDQPNLTADTHGTRLKRRHLNEKLQKHSYKTDFLAHYFLDWYKYAISRSLTAPQTSAILEIAYKSHAFYVESPPTNLSSSPEVVEFFKRLMIAHSVLDLPQSIRVFSANQCVDAVEYFVRSYVKLMPIVKFLHFPNAPMCPNEVAEGSNGDAKL